MSITADEIWAASPSTTRGQPTPLSSDSKGERIAYASNKSVFVRSIDNPSISKQYTQHVAQTTVARFSPSGFYVASGDVSGSVRVWDCVGEGATKGEYHIIAGRINDIAWDGDSHRIIAVGNGKERFGHCITADSGNSIGDIVGHSSQINCVSIRQQRPLRAATGSDDTTLGFFHGVPFKFNTSLRGQHNKYIYGTAFSPDGSSLVSVGSDRRIWLYDGKTGEVKGQIGEGEHRGSIFGVSWAKDSKRFVTASADQTVKVWDAEAGKVVQAWRMGDEGVVSIPDQQVGVTWPSGRSDDLIISVDLEGNLNYLSLSNPKPVRIVRGHQKSITAAALTGSTGHQMPTLCTGSSEGRVLAWDISKGEAFKIGGESHSNYVSSFATAANATTATDSKDSGNIYSVAWDDTLRTFSPTARTFTDSPIKLPSQPRGVAVSHTSDETKILVATSSSVEIYDDSGNKLGELSNKYPPTAIAASGAMVAIGSDDKLVRTYTLSSDNSLTPVTDLKDSTSPITTLSYSQPTSSTTSSHPLLAVGTSTGKIYVYSTADHSLITNRWSAHTARVTGISWRKDGKWAVSGSLDTNLFVWSVENPGKRVRVSNAHKDGVNGVQWVDDDGEGDGRGERVVSVGGDAAVKVWRVEGLD